MPPLAFSVVIPCYNRPDLLARALQSCLAQQFRPFEVVVVDDASSVDVLRAAEALRPTFLQAGVTLTCVRRNDNGGPSAARNEGWQLARGEYVAFLDADDVWHPSKLLVMHAALQQSDAECAYHGYAILNDAPTPASPVAVNEFTSARVGVWSGLWRNFSATPCFVVRRDVPERFDEAMRYLEDHDLWLRIARRKPLLHLAGPPLTWLGRPPKSPGGLSAARWQMRRGEIAMYTKFCRGTPRIAALPVLVGWSLLKHGYAAARDVMAGQPAAKADGKPH